MNENVFESNLPLLTEDLCNGFRSVLYKRINNITINDVRISNAFKAFVGKVECGTTLSISELINSAEALINGGFPEENAGNIIYAYEGTPKNPKIKKNSVCGLYSLFSLHSGVILDIKALGGSLSGAEVKRFLIAPSSKASGLINKAKSEGILMYQIGKLISENKIILCDSAQVLESIDKRSIASLDSSVSITLDGRHFNAYRDGFLAVCSLVLSNQIAVKNILRFSLNGDIATVFARALGYFTAALQLKSAYAHSIFTNESVCTIAVPRPTIADGDYFYLLKLRLDENGLPDRSHFAQLNYYLAEKKRSGIIKDVLPVKENIQGLLSRLGGENLEYEEISAVPDNSFGIIVSARRGESLNGIKLGFFKSN